MGALTTCDEDVPRTVEYLLANTTGTNNNEDVREPRRRPHLQPKSRPQTPTTITTKRKDAKESTLPPNDNNNHNTTEPSHIPTTATGTHEPAPSAVTTTPRDRTPANSHPTSPRNRPGSKNKTGKPEGRSAKDARAAAGTRPVWGQDRSRSAWTHEPKGAEPPQYNNRAEQATGQQPTHYHFAIGSSGRPAPREGAIQDPATSTYEWGFRHPPHTPARRRTNHRCIGSY